MSITIERLHYCECCDLKLVARGTHMSVKWAKNRAGIELQNLIKTHISTKAHKENDNEFRPYKLVVDEYISSI